MAKPHPEVQNNLQSISVLGSSPPNHPTRPIPLQPTTTFSNERPLAHTSTPLHVSLSLFPPGVSSPPLRSSLSTPPPFSLSRPFLSCFPSTFSFRWLCSAQFGSFSSSLFCSVLAATLAGTSRLVNTPHVPSLYVLVLRLLLCMDPKPSPYPAHSHSDSLTMELYPRNPPAADLPPPRTINSLGNWRAADSSHRTPSKRARVAGRFVCPRWRGR